PFFFSSRRRHTRSKRDWSSDVCSSDLFVVEDMTDVDAFGPTGVDLPDSPLYLIQAPDRGDEFENASPAEALEAIAAGGRSPLLLTEGLLWVLQVPAVLARNPCFMTIGSR